MNGPSSSVSRMITTTMMQRSERPSMKGAIRGSSFCSGWKSICFSGIAPPLVRTGVCRRGGTEAGCGAQHRGLALELAALQDHKAPKSAHHQDDPEHGHDVGAGGVR